MCGSGGGNSAGGRGMQSRTEVDKVAAKNTSVASVRSGEAVSNVVAGGRGSTVGETAKSSAQQGLSDAAAGFAGNALGTAVGGPVGGLIGGRFAKSLSAADNTNEIDLSTGKSTAKPGMTDRTNSTNSGAAVALLSKNDTPVDLASTVNTEASSTDSSSSSSSKPKTATILAGRGIAKDKLKTRLGS